MKRKIAAVVIGGTLLTGAKAGAHHSFPATYSVNKTIRIEGRVTQLLLRNPHSFLQIEAPDVSGQMQRWSLEWGGATQLLGQGVVKDTLKVGDALVVTANPARSTENATRALVKTIMRPSDGWSWGMAAGQVVE